MQDRTILQQLNKINQQRISNLEKENALLKQEGELKDRIIEIDQKEIAATNRALDQMKEVTDRALKLADSGKPSIWETYGPIAVIAILIITVASVL